MTAASLSAVAGYVRRIHGHDTRGLTDPQLLDRFTRHQDEQAFAELVRRHGPMVLLVCRRVLRHEQDAEDAFQATFLVLARKAASIRQRDAVGSWLHQVAHRLALRARASADRRREQLTALSEGFATAGPGLRGDSFGFSLDEEVQRLPEPYRSAVVLCYLEGRTQSEVARLLATTTNTVNSRLKRARDLLRQRLARCGLVLSSVAVADALAAGSARAALTPALVRLIARAALQFTIHGAPASGVSPVAAALAKGALHGMISAKLKFLSALAVFMVVLAVGPLLMSPPALGDDPPAVALGDAGKRSQPTAEDRPTPPPASKAKPRRSCILLWMDGGPSQIDTFDPKPGEANGALFGAIDTNVKGIQISQNLPALAKVANHLAIIRTVTHRDGDHNRATHLMRTSYEYDGLVDYPNWPCILAKELGDSRPGLPRYIQIDHGGYVGQAGRGPGFLGPQYGPLIVKGQSPLASLTLPSVEAFDVLARGKGEAMRQAVAKAFDLAEEKAEVRDAYGRGLFGQGCLLARRLVERGVPVVEVSLGGWDMHANAARDMPQRSADLDAGWAMLLKDLHERKQLDSTLVVWMGEFGRTPRINVQGGRDHWPSCFSAVLAGGGIKAGQVIGKTSADGIRIEERPVTPSELVATIYKALGLDLARENRTPDGRMIPIVADRGRAMKEMLR
jgi:RNA polymerase sigma factor (sigma-70 family)